MHNKALRRVKLTANSIPAGDVILLQSVLLCPFFGLANFAGLFSFQLLTFVCRTPFSVALFFPREKSSYFIITFSSPKRKRNFSILHLSSTRYPLVTRKPKQAGRAISGYPACFLLSFLHLRRSLSHIDHPGVPTQGVFPVVRFAAEGVRHLSRPEHPVDPGTHQ